LGGAINPQVIDALASAADPAGTDFSAIKGTFKWAEKISDNDT
jgi:hypothetical protein